VFIVRYINKWYCRSKLCMYYYK